MSPSNPQIETALYRLIDDVQSNIKALESLALSSSTSLSEYREADKRKELENAGALISHAATKLSLFTNSKSLEVIPLCEELSRALSFLIIVCSSLPEGLGKTCIEDLKSGISSLFIDVASLANSLLDKPVNLTEKLRCTTYQISTGLVWKACDVLKKIPLNNTDACQAKLSSVIELVEDALREVDEQLVEPVAGEDADDGWAQLLDDDEEDDEGLDRDGPTEFTQEERETVRKLSTLIKSSKLVLSKILKMIKTPPPPPAAASSSSPSSSASTSTTLNNNKDDLRSLQQQIQILDDIVSKGKALQEAVDDLGSIIDAPLQMREITFNASALSKAVSELISIAKSHVASDSACIHWFEMCEGHVYRLIEKILVRDTNR